MRLVILDRDGVINEDSEDFIKSPEEWIPIPGSLEAIAMLNRADYHVVVNTNQSGIARGMLDIDTLTRIHNKMHDALKGAGGIIDAIFFCPHGPDDNCECRKPRPGLLLDIAERLQADIRNCPVIGDAARDLDAAIAAGAFPVLVRTGRGRETEAALEPGHGIPVHDDLLAAVQSLLEQDSQ